MLWLKIVQSVVESLVKLSLSHTTEKTKGKDFPHRIHHPVKNQIEGQPVVPDAVQNPGSPSSAQVELGREQMAVSDYNSILEHL